MPDATFRDRPPIALVKQIRGRTQASHTGAEPTARTAPEIAGDSFPEPFTTVTLTRRARGQGAQTKAASKKQTLSR